MITGINTTEKLSMKYMKALKTGSSYVTV